MQVNTLWFSYHEYPLVSVFNFTIPSSVLALIWIYNILTEKFIHQWRILWRTTPTDNTKLYYALMFKPIACSCDSLNVTSEKFETEQFPI